MEDLTATITEHFSELRKTLILIILTVCVSSALSFYYYEPLFKILTAPLVESSAGVKDSLVLFNPLEGFMIALKTSFFCGVLLSSPLWVTFLLQFILPGLRPRESKMVLPFVLFSYLFLCLGIYIAFSATIPFANQYFYAFNTGIGQNLWSASEYLSYTLTLLIAHGAVFEFFVALLFLVHFRILTVRTMQKYRRQVILGAFIVGAITTPPDVFTQVIMSLFILGIYELAIIYAKFRQRSKKSTLKPMREFPK